MNTWKLGTHASNRLTLPFSSWPLKSGITHHLLKFIMFLTVWVSMEQTPSVIVCALSRPQYFDLHDMYIQWVNLPHCKDKQLDYSQFLQVLARFEDIPENEKV